MHAVAIRYAAAGAEIWNIPGVETWPAPAEQVRVMSGRPILQLYTTLAEFEVLHERHDRTRSTSKTVAVDRQALIHVLMDHARMLEALRKVDVAEPR